LVVNVATEDMSNLKGEMKILEEKNLSYIQRTLDLEEVFVVIVSESVSK